MPQGRAKKRAERLIQWWLFIVLLISYTYFFPRWADWSQNSRLNLTLAIVDHGSLSVDPYFGNTGDYAKFEGHYYTDKAPGPSFLGVPVYMAFRPILHSGPVQSVLERLSNNAAFSDTLNEEGTGLQTDKIYYFVVLVIVTFFVSSVLSALLGVLLYRFLREMSVSRPWAVVGALIYGLATPAFTYAGAFFSHQLTAFLLFCAFYIGFKIKLGQLSPAWLIAAGFMLGYSLISEYPTFLIALGVFIYIVWHLVQSQLFRRWIVPFIASGAVPGILLVAYNFAIFHTPLPVGYEYSELYTDIHSQGLISLTYPHAEALWGITFGSFRGLFYVAPVLLLAVIGIVLWWQWRRFQAEAIVCTWALVSFLLFNGSSVMWQGGYSVGPRYLVPMIPFLALGFGPLFIHWGQRLTTRIAVGLLAVYSWLVVWIETIGGQNYPDWTQAPLFNYSIPNLLKEDIARNWGMGIGLRGWASLLPILLFLGVAGILLVTRLSPASSQPVSQNPGER